MTIEDTQYPTTFNIYGLPFPSVMAGLYIELQVDINFQQLKKWVMHKLVINAVNNEGIFLSGVEELLESRFDRGSYTNHHLHYTFKTTLTSDTMLGIKIQLVGSGGPHVYYIEGCLELKTNELALDCSLKHSPDDLAFSDNEAWETSSDSSIEVVDIEERLLDEISLE